MTKKTFKDFGIKPEALEIDDRFAITDITFVDERYTVNTINAQVDSEGEGKYFTPSPVPISALEDENIHCISLYRNDVFDYMIDIAITTEWDFRLPLPINCDKGEGNDYIPEAVNFSDIIDMEHIINNNFHITIAANNNKQYSIYCKDGKVSVLEDEPNDKEVTPALDNYLRKGKLFDKEIIFVHIYYTPNLGVDILFILDGDFSLIDELEEA